MPIMDEQRDERARYDALVDGVMPLYGEGRHGEALARVAAEAPSLPGHRADTAHLAACLRALEGDPNGAYDELRAAFEAGAWWHRQILLEDDDLAAVRALPGFDDLVAAAHARCLAAADHARPAPVLLHPDGPARGALVVLHGAGRDGVREAPEWRAAVDAGFLVLAVTSAQRSTPTYRSWPDPAAGTEQVRQALHDAREAVGGLPLVAAGFSAGGRQAMQWALGPDPAGPVGFLAVGPAITPDEVTAEGVAAAAARGVRGTVVMGAQDGLADGARRTCELLTERGLPCRYDVVDGLGHHYPDDFADRLRKGLDSLLPPA